MNKKNPSKTAVSFWQIIVLTFLGLCLSLVLLEMGMRLGGFVLLSVQEYGNLQSIKQKGTYRILCLGESTTQGQYPRLLEQILNQRNIGVRFSVIDKGRRTTNTPAILSRVESYLTGYHPDMVVAMMGVNDWGTHIPFEATAASGETTFVQSLKIYKLTRFLRLHLLAKAKEMGFYKPAEDRQSSWKAQTPVPKTGLKESSAEAVSIEEPSRKAVESSSPNDKVVIDFEKAQRDPGQYQQDENALKRAVELNPKNSGAYRSLGRLYRDQGNFSKAEDSFQKAVELDPKSDKAYVGLGALSLMQGKASQAEASWKKAIELNPKNSEAYHGLAMLYRGDHPDHAEVMFKKALEANPKNLEACSDLGWLYRRQKRFLQAEDSFKKAMEQSRSQDDDGYTRGRALRAMVSLYEEMGKPELAKKYVEEIHALRPEYYIPVTVNNYRKLKEILDRKEIKLVCVQYPVRNVEPLKRIFGKEEGVIFVDNENLFKEAVKRSSYKDYFIDMFGGDFGHCTQKGNELLAQNIAEVILREVFKSEK